MKKNYIKLTLQVVILVQVLLCQGCNVLGFLATPGPFEKKIPPDYDLKPIASQKIMVWVEALPGSGAGLEVVAALHQSILGRLVKKAGISQKYILTANPSATLAYNPTEKPEAVGRKFGAGVVLYVRIEESDMVNLHSNTIYSGQMRARAFLIRSENGEVLCPKDPSGMVADVATEMTTRGIEEIIAVLGDAASHCIVRRLYPCTQFEYKVNEERSTMNEMIRQDVY